MSSETNFFHQQYNSNSKFDTKYNYLNDLANASYTPIDLKTSEFEDGYLELSYSFCHNIIKNHSKSFSLASSLLDNERRDAIAALYSFCRITDDIIDKESIHRAELFDSWRKNVSSPIPNIADPVNYAWLHTRAKYEIPEDYLLQLIDGVAMDTSKNRYNTYEELVKYCYHVASTVGLMSMHIIGFTDTKAIPFAINMGIALQLTNIIRDVGEDYSMGRIYLPQEELDRFGITEKHFRDRIIDDAWMELMKFQIERARQLFEDSWKGLSLLESKGKWSIKAAAVLYREILKKVEHNNYDNISKRAFVSKKRKLFLLSKMLVD